MNYFVIFGIIILAFITSMILSWLVMRALRTRHPGIWEAMGRPRRIDIKDRSTPGGEHFWVTGYKKLDDPRFESLVDLLKTFNSVLGVIIVVFLILMVGKLILGYR